MRDYLRFRYGLRWPTSKPPLGRLLGWGLAAGIAAALAAHAVLAAERREASAELALQLSTRLNDVLAVKMSGAPCTLPGDFVEGK